MRMIKFTQGDDNVVLDLTAALENGLRPDLTGAVFSTQVLGVNGVAITYPDGQHTADPDQVANRGKYTLTLAASDTSAIPAGTNKEIVTQISVGGQIIYYHGPGILTVLTSKPIK